MCKTVPPPTSSEANLKEMLPAEVCAEECDIGTCAGATDAQDGPATNEPWIRALQWPGRRAFNGAERRLWRMPVALVRLGSQERVFAMSSDRVQARRAAAALMHLGLSLRPDL